MCKVVLIGGGVLGSQIAYQTQYWGIPTTIWLRSEGSIGRCQPKLDRLHDIYEKDLEDSKKYIGQKNAPVPRALFDDFASLTAEDIDALKEKADQAYHDLTLTLDLAEALKNADLVIEALAEDPKQKAAFYAKAAPLMEEKTILVTNSSTLLPSELAQYTGRPEKFMALHFANEIWKNNTAEVMGHPGTDPAVYDAVVKYAQDIHMIPLKLKKEQRGYLLNSLLIPLLMAGQSLLANDVADVETIDAAWTLGTGAPAGPFRILDIVGLETAYNIVIMSPDAKDPNTTAGKIAAILKSKMDEGKTGVNAGEGFYKYR